MTLSTCKQKLALITPYICVVIAAIFIILSTTTLPSVLKSSIEDELKMVPQTYEFWGQSPGQTKSVTKRNFTFFNFTNPREFLYQNKTPVFNQVHGYLLQQRFNYTDYKYSENMDEVFYNDWLYFTELEDSRSLDQKFNVLNIGPLGFWYQLDLVGLPTFALQGFGGLFVELNETFKTQAIGQGVQSQFLLNYSNWKSVCANNQIPQLQCNNTWEDPQHGLSDQNNYEIWVDFSYMKDQESQRYLQTYFGFDDMQMQGLETLFDQWSDTVNQIVNNWFCQGNECTSNQLTMIQLSSGRVTGDPPSGDAVDSICDTGNVTCIGQPEISKYLNNEFKKNFPEEKYQKLKFSTQTFRHLFTPYKGTLLNIGNLTELFETGSQFDQSQSIIQRSSLLQLIKKQTHAQTADHAFVIWQWVKYFTNQFVIKFSKGGSEKNSGIGGVFAQAFYESFSDFGGWVMDDYLSVLGKQMINDCALFAKETISGISEQKVKSICSQVNNNTGYFVLFEPCFGSLQGKQKFRASNNLTLYEFGQYCDTQEKSFYTVAMQIHQQLFTHYNCSPTKGVKMCSHHQLSMKQFINSQITLNPISTKTKSYPISLTAKTWNPQLSEFEYKNYLKQAYGDQNIDTQLFTETQLIDMLSFDKLFSASMVMELLLENNQPKFEKLYYWKNMTLLKNFVKFITVQVGFGGFTQQRSVKELLFGYQDPFLKGLQVTDTMMGGDPSINPVVMLNEPNITEQEAKLFPQSVYTGYSDIASTRQYSSLFGYKYITYNKTWYDGYEIQSEFVSPYKAHVPVKGTDAIQHPPGLDQKSSIYCLITNVYRTAQLNYVQHSEMYGVDLLTFNVDKSFLASQSQYQPNSVFYQKFQGFHNVTFLGVPLHISKNNFYSCPSNWSELIQVYDETGMQQIKGSKADDTVLRVQPNTGALFFASVRLQTNYHFQNDILFGPGSRMLPITNVIRQGEIDGEIVDQLFGDLKMVLSLQKVLLILATIMVPLSLIAIAYRCYTENVRRRQESEIEKSLIVVEDEGSLITDSGTVVKPFLGREGGQSEEQIYIARNKRERQVNNSPQQPFTRNQQISATIMTEDYEINPSSSEISNNSLGPNINATILDN